MSVAVRFQGPVEAGVFVSRPNRFLTYCRVGEEVRACFCANPGRMGEFLEPGRPVLVGPRIGGQAGKTTHVHLAFRHEGRWVSIDTRVPGQLFREGFQRGRFPFLAGYDTLRAEVPFGHSRFDFLLTGARKRPCIVEVKSATLVEDGVARWPDAPSERGARHASALADAVRDGYRAVVLFIVQRADARHLEPHAARDPAFARALGEAAAAGVEVRAWGSRVTRQGITLADELPVVTGARPASATRNG